MQGQRRRAVRVGIVDAIATSSGVEPADLAARVRWREAVGQKVPASRRLRLRSPRDGRWGIATFVRIVLAWSDVDFDAGLLRVTANGREFSPKSHAERTVPLNEELLAYLRGLRNEHPQAEWVCLNCELGRWSLGLHSRPLPES